jgi:predicted DNA-binding transcriptional regulator AlpA
VKPLPPVNKRTLGRYLNQAQFRAWTGWSRTTVYRLIQENRIPYRNISKRPLIDPWEVIEQIRRYNAISALNNPSGFTWPPDRWDLEVIEFPFIPAKQYALRRGISTASLYRMLRSRKIPHYQIKGSYYVDADEISAFLDASKVKTIEEEIDWI